MDKTLGYIQKLEKAPEIQRAWGAPQDGDFVWHPNEGVEHMGTWEFPEKFDIVSLVNHDEEWWYHWLWLPRQDQLQKMIYFRYSKNCSTPYRKIIVDFETFTDDLDLICSLDSMEQLWLAFIMYEKYSKTWDGKDWVKK